MAKLLLVSVHKSGTNMLTQAIGGSHQQIDGKVNRDEIHPHPDTLQDIQTFTRFARSHLVYNMEYAHVLRESGGKGIFLYRDPRDCIVSWAHYADDVVGYKGFINFELNNGKRLSDLSISERITEIIKVAKFEYGRYAKWLGTSDKLVYKLRYEDMLLKRHETFQNLINWMGSDLVATLSTEFDCSRPEYMISRIDPKNCNTFRKGTIGDWKNHFTREQELLFWTEMTKTMKKMRYD